MARSVLFVFFAFFTAFIGRSFLQSDLFIATASASPVATMQLRLSKFAPIKLLVSADLIPDTTTTFSDYKPDSTSVGVERFKATYVAQASIFDCAYSTELPLCNQPVQQQVTTTPQLTGTETLIAIGFGSLFWILIIWRVREWFKPKRKPNPQSISPWWQKDESHQSSKDEVLTTFRLLPMPVSQEVIGTARPTPDQVADTPKGLSGWLILLGVGLAFHALFGLTLPLKDWVALSQVPASSALYSALQVELWAFGLVNVLAPVLLLILFFGKDRLFPESCVIWLWAVAALQFLGVPFLESLFGLPLSGYGHPQAENVIATLVQAAIWTSYIAKSKRVAITFGNSWSRTDESLKDAETSSLKSNFERLQVKLEDKFHFNGSKKNIGIGLALISAVCVGVWFIQPNAEQEREQEQQKVIRKIVHSICGNGPGTFDSNGRVICNVQ